MQLASHVARRCGGSVVTRGGMPGARRGSAVVLPDRRRCYAVGVDAATASAITDAEWHSPEPPGDVVGGSHVAASADGRGAAAAGNGASSQAAADVAVNAHNLQHVAAARHDIRIRDTSSVPPGLPDDVAGVDGPVLSWEGEPLAESGELHSPPGEWSVSCREWLSSL